MEPGDGSAGVSSRVRDHPVRVGMVFAFVEGGGDAHGTVKGLHRAKPRLRAFVTSFLREDENVLAGPAGRDSNFQLDSAGDCRIMRADG